MRRLTLIPPPDPEKERQAEARERLVLVEYVDQKEFEQKAEVSLWRMLLDVLMLR